MAKQAVYVQDGKVIDYTPSVAVSVGDVITLTNFCGVALASVAASESVAVKLDGVYSLTTDTGAAWSVGAKVYWDATNKVATATATNNTMLGYALEAKASAITTCKIRLQF